MRRGPGASSWSVISRSAATGIGFEWLNEAAADVCSVMSVRGSDGCEEGGELVMLFGCCRVPVLAAGRCSSPGTEGGDQTNRPPCLLPRRCAAMPSCVMRATAGTHGSALIGGSGALSGVRAPVPGDPFGGWGCSCTPVTQDDVKAIS